MSKTAIRICQWHGEQKHYLNQKSWRCLKCSAEGVTAYTVRRKKKLIELSGGACCLCNYSVYYGALEFHHLNPSQKSFGISAKGSATKSIEKIIPEVNKCILVCSRCHAEIEGGLHKDKNLAQYQISINIRDIKPIKEPKYCTCGALINTKANRCTPCAAKKQEKIQWPSTTELLDMLNQSSYVLVAKALGVSDNSIRKRLRNHPI